MNPAPHHRNRSYPRGVVWLAPWQNPSGYCSEALAFAQGLAGAWPLELVDSARVRSPAFVDGLPETTRSLLRAKLTAKPHIAGKIIIQHMPGSGFGPVPGTAYCVGRTMFETDRLPPNWAEKCNQLDEIWVPSRFNLETFAASGVAREKIFVVPGAVDETLFNPTKHEPWPLPHRSSCNFLSVFEWSARKGWDVLLAAYLREFSAADDVCLNLRVYLTNRPDADARAVIGDLIGQFAATLGLGDKQLPRVEILTGQIPTRELPRLYRAVDCLVAPSRGEGWGRPHHEAMMMGVPVIATNWSGNTEFMTPENSYPLDFELVEATQVEPEFAHYRGHRWALASEKHLRERMRHVQQHPDEARERGRRGREHVLRHFSLQPVAQVVLQRLKAIEQKLSAPARRETAAPVRPPVRVSWEGSFLDHGSLSHVNRELTAALKAFPEVQCQCVSNGAPVSPGFEKLSQHLSSSRPARASVTVRHAWPPDWRRPPGGKLVVIQPWEFGSLPESWVKDSKQVDEFWVPSGYVRRVYVESGVPGDKVVVVPNGVDPEKFHPQVVPMKLATLKRFKFLFVGGTIFRKGPDLLLKAYLDHFTASDDVCLVIKDFGGKTIYAGQTFESQIRAAQSHPDAPEILYLNEELPPDALPGLYTACDCLVLPYRGEGFGLPALEAMACSLPVIVTAGGAMDDFVHDDFAWRIPAERRVFGHEISGLKLAGAGWLLEPDMPSLSRSMREAFTNPPEARRRGQLAAQYAKQFYSWQNAAAIAAGRIRELASAGAGVPPSGGTPNLKSSPHPEAAPVLKIKITLPPCARVGHLGEARDLIRQKKFPAAWTSVMQALAVRPFHPEACLLLAEIAQTIGAGPVAKLCAERARSFAPGWKPAKKFLNQRLKGGAEPEWLQLSAIRRPPSLPRLSVCLIVKNEERFLGRCLKSVGDLASQIVVVDTGSTDRTVEIAKEHGAEIYAFAWCDDFSAARNAALEHATGDWVLMLDADEELSAEGREKLNLAMNDPAVMAWRLPIVDVGREAEGCSYVPRLYRNAPGLFYVGRVHEQVFSSIEVRRAEWGLANRIGDATLIHYGYTAELTRDRNKVERNLQLLERAIKELPDEPHLLMNLGLELARSGREAEALERYREAFTVLASKPAAEIVPELRETLLMQLCARLTAAKRFDEVVRTLTSPLAGMNRGLTASLHFSLGLSHLELRQFSEAADQMRQCLAKHGQRSLAPISKEINTAAPHHCLALCLVKLGDVAAAEKAFQDGLKETGHGDALRLDYAGFLAGQNRPVDALQQLNEVVTANARHLGAWRLGGQIALSRAEFLEFARDWTGEAMRHVSEDPLVLAQRAETLMLSEDTAGALELWERVWNQAPQPTVLAALILCEAVELPTTHAPEGQGEAAASRAFIDWYRKLLTVKAHKTIGRLNEHADKLSRTLPGAVRMLEAALTEVSRAGSAGV